MNIIRLREKLTEWNIKNSTYKFDKIKKQIDHYSQTITTIAICANISILVSSTLSGLLFTVLLNNPDIGDGVSLGVLTLILIFLGEVIPKHYARNNPEKVSIYLFWFILGGALLFSPVLFLCNKLLKTTKKVTATEKELKEIVKKIKNEGILEETEKTLILRAIEFDDTLTKDVYTPLKSIVFEHSYSLNYDDIAKYFLMCSYNRLPIIDGNNQPLGVIKLHPFAKKILDKNIVLAKDYDFTTMINYCPIIREDTNLSIALNNIQRTRGKCAFVVNKNNKLLGMIFTSDLLNQIFGNFYSENVYNNKYAKIGYKKYIVTACCNANYFAKSNNILSFKTNKKMTFEDLVIKLNNGKKLQYQESFDYNNFKIYAYLNYKGEIIYEVSERSKKN